MPAATALQSAIWTALAGSSPPTALYTAVGGRIYDKIPQSDEAAPDALFPYIVIGDDDISNDDTDTGLGFTARVQVNVVSRYPGWKQIKDLQGQVYDLLHRAVLAIPGYTFTDSFVKEQHLVTNPDGKTREGVVIVSVMFQA